MKENLEVEFTEKLDEETKTQGEGSRTSRFDHPRTLVKNQAKSKPPITLLTDPSTLERCLNFPSGTISSSGFDDNIVIAFFTALLGSPVTPNLKFINQTATLQSKPLLAIFLI